MLTKKNYIRRGDNVDKKTKKEGRQCWQKKLYKEGRQCRPKKLKRRGDNVDKKN